MLYSIEKREDAHGVLYVYREGVPLTQKQILRLAGRMATINDGDYKVVSFKNIHVAIFYMFSFFVAQLGISVGQVNYIRSIQFDNCFNSLVFF